jgi:type IV pilus assembly protein PilY1
MSAVQHITVGCAATLGRALALGLLSLLPTLGHAQALNDIPMAVKNNVAPNFMFMIDNSGSMLNIVPSEPYVATATYLTTCPAPATGLLIPAANTFVEIRLNAAGEPFARIGGVDRRHVSVTGTGNRVCFTNTVNYRASLYNPVGGYGTGTYTGHYLNWYFGNYGGHPMTGWTDRKRVTTGSVLTRLDIARSSATSVISGLPITTPANVRVGLSTFNNGNGGALRVGMADLTAAHLNSLTTSIAGLSAGGVTPLAETLADIGRYMATGYSGNITAGPVSGVTINNFLRQDGRQSCLSGANCFTTTTDTDASPTIGTPSRPIQYWCQRSYAFVMTDGLSNGDQAFVNNTHLRDYDRDCQGALAATCVSNGAPAAWDRKTSRFYEAQGSDYLDDVAKALFDVDLRPNLPSPDPVGKPKKNNLVTYAIGFADQQLQNDPLMLSTARQGGGKALFPLTPSELTSAFNAVVTDAFASNGAAAAVAVANAQITQNNIGYASSYRAGAWYGDLRGYSISTTTGLQVGPDLWSLRQTVGAMAPASRKIATYNGTNGVAFAAGLSYPGKPSSLTDGVIDYLRGVRTNEDNITYRVRQDILGDIINAEPLVVDYGGVPIIFQGANDGMLHVVDGRTEATVPTRGQELWAYVPQLVHQNLAALANPDYDHLYYVDGTPAAAQITGVTGVTRMLVGSLGKGGRGYYALNISSYTAASQADAVSKVMWEFSPAGMGYSFGTPLIVKVGSNWRVVVTSGYDATVHGIWILDPATGTGPFVAAPSASGLAHVNRLDNTTADADTRFIWGGDNAGNVYRFDLVSETATRIATLTDISGQPQPVTSAPAVARVSGSSTKYVVFIGTGRYLGDADVPGAGANSQATQRQSIYGLMDDVTVASPTMPNLRGSNGASCPSNGGDGDLVCQALSYNTTEQAYESTANAVDFASKRGWYTDLPTSAVPANGMINGRVTGRPGLTTGGTLAVVVNVPTNVLCQPGGRSWLLQLSSRTGGAVPRVVGGNTYYSAGTYLGDVLSSRPQLVVGAGGGGGDPSNPVSEPPCKSGKRALMRLSDGTTKSVCVEEESTLAAPWRRIYSRPVN